MNEEHRLLSLINAETDSLRELLSMHGDWMVFQNILEACDKINKLYDELSAQVEMRLLLERV